MNQKMYEDFIKAGQKALTMSHYELNELFHNKYPITEWKEFLLDPKVQDYIRTEFSIISESNLRKVMSSVDEEGKSVGQAQLINAMISATEKTTNKRDGNIIIYSYILPNEQQAKAPNTQVIKRDPFQEDNKNDN